MRSKLEQRAREAAANAWCGPKAYGALEKGLLGNTDRLLIDRLAAAIVEVAREFAAEAIRSMFDVTSDPHGLEQITLIDPRSRIQNGLFAAYYGGIMVLHDKHPISVDDFVRLAIDAAEE